MRYSGCGSRSRYLKVSFERSLEPTTSMASQLA